MLAVRYSDISCAAFPLPRLPNCQIKLCVAKPRHVCDSDYAGFEHVKSVEHAQNVHNVCVHTFFLKGY
jgi:hypothetical protein